jgi:hypothetical protein
MIYFNFKDVDIDMSSSKKAETILTIFVIMHHHNLSI